MSGPRGEGRLALAGGEVVEILFTNRALAEAETITGKSILQLADAGRSFTLGMGDVSKLLLVGMTAAKRDAGTGGARPTLQDAWRVLDAVGFLAVATAVVDALAAVLSYAPEEAAEEDPTP